MQILRDHVQTLIIDKTQLEEGKETSQQILAEEKGTARMIIENCLIIKDIY